MNAQENRDASQNVTNALNAAQGGRDPLGGSENGNNPIEGTSGGISVPIVTISIPQERPPPYNSLPFYNWFATYDNEQVAKLLNKVQKELMPCGLLQVLIGAFAEVMELLIMRLGAVGSYSSYALWAGFTFMMTGVFSTLFAMTKPLNKSLMRICIIFSFASLLTAIFMLMIEFNRLAPYNRTVYPYEHPIFYIYRLIIAIMELLILYRQAYVYSYYYKKARMLMHSSSAEIYTHELEFDAMDPVRLNGVVVEVTERGYRIAHPSHNAPPAYNLHDSPSANLGAPPIREAGGNTEINSPTHNFPGGRQSGPIISGGQSGPINNGEQSGPINNGGQNGPVNNGGQNGSLSSGIQNGPVNNWRENGQIYNGGQNEFLNNGRNEALNNRIQSGSLSSGIILSPRAGMNVNHDARRQRTPRLRSPSITEE